MDQEQYFINLYISAKRNIMKNNFIKSPKTGSKQYQNLIDAANLVENMHADPIDFIQFFIKRLSPLRIFPQPYHLVSKKLIEKYRYHQSLKNRYIFADYMMCGDDFTINRTYEVVSYRDAIMLPVDKDLRLKTVMFMCTQKDHKLTDKDKKDIAYAFVKLNFLGKPVPEKLKMLYRKEVEENDNGKSSRISS
jgi:hypothetical protein